MATVKKPLYGVHVYMNSGGNRITWYNNLEAQDRAYHREKKKAGPGKKYSHVKKVTRS